jgi:phospholipase C
MLSFSPGPSARAQAGASARPAAAVAGASKIRHVIIIMQENRSFDSYFGTFRHADGIPGLAGHRGKVPCLPNPSGHCVRPFHDRRDLNHGGAHFSGNAYSDIDHGKMDGFVRNQEKSCHHCRTVPPHDVMGYHTKKDIPNYWGYAHHFVLQDHMFQPDVSWSLPAHLYLVSLWSAHCRSAAPSSCKTSVNRPGNPANWGRHPTHRRPHYSWTDLTYLLHKHKVSWRYYIFRGIEPDCESDTAKSCAPVTQGPRTQSIWNPLPDFETVRHDHQLGNIKSLNGFFDDINKGKLPAVSWIMPSQKVSEHPETALIRPGQTYVTGLINTIMQSPVWKSCAIFVAWDDWGGFYDNVRPPRIDKEGYGLRVPAFMISPYARQGYVDHQTLSFDAYAKFIEDIFLGGQRLNPHTDGRPDPRPDVREKAPHLGNLMEEFNFGQPPRKPYLLPVHPKTDLIG